MLVISEQVDISGAASATDGAIVTVDRIRNRCVPRSWTAVVANGNWAVHGIPLDPDLNVFRITIEHSSATIYVTRAANVRPRPQQRLRLVWDPETDASLRKIATTTIVPSPDDVQLAQFTASVRQRVLDIVANAYEHIAAIALVDGDGPDVNTINFEAADMIDLLGRSPSDTCGSAPLPAESEVFVGTFATLMSKDLPSWLPMSVTDSVAVRAEDVAQALGRTAVHESAHALGLVANDDSAHCGWMHGCDGGHSCETFQTAYPGVNRFRGGGFVMDPGFKTSFVSRIGEQTKGARAPRRTPAVFDEFDAQYLSLLLPPR
jgi:hypothetical protein